mgnify:CR=1 FL=1
MNKFKAGAGAALDSVKANAAAFAVAAAGSIIAFAKASVTAFQDLALSAGKFADASKINTVFVKGQRFCIAGLLDDEKLAARYQSGSLILSRLCPVDYHRFHFPCSGMGGT